MPPATDYFLTTARLGLRHWRAEDLDLARGLWGDPQVARWIDTRGQLTDDQVRERLAGEIRLQRDHGVQYWPLFRIDNSRHVGCCGLRPHDPAARIYELGFHIGAHSWRKGYAVEAARAVIAHAFGPLGAAGLFAGHHPRNRASRQLLLKLGFQYTHDEYYAATGCQHPSYRLTAAGHVPEKEVQSIVLEKEPGELYKILKFENLVNSGGEAKHMIAQGDVRVNGQIETRKRKKIVAGDRIEFEDTVYRVTVPGRKQP
jgi:RimJ/RimL family protein N-acetyltransferase/ribosome-associated protein YbcJ (S4-like RNA binding protein)